MNRRVSRPRGLCDGEERLDAGGAKVLRSEFIGDGTVDERRVEVEVEERSRRSWGRRSWTEPRGGCSRVKKVQSHLATKI